MKEYKRLCRSEKWTAKAQENVLEEMSQTADAILKLVLEPRLLSVLKKHLRDPG
jgi:hypothetical protein